MITLSKTFITYGLSLLLLSGLLHVDLNNEVYEGYGICNFDCNKGEHHSLTHLCEQCLTNQDRLLVNRDARLFINEYQLSLLVLNEKYRKPFTFFYLYSRPPPKSSFI